MAICMCRGTKENELEMMRWLDNYPKEVRIFLLASLVNATGSALDVAADHHVCV